MSSCILVDVSGCVNGFVVSKLMKYEVESNIAQALFVKSCSPGRTLSSDDGLTREKINMDNLWLQK